MITITDVDAAVLVRMISEHGRLAALPVEKFFETKKKQAIIADFEPDTDKTIADSYHNE